MAAYGMRNVEIIEHRFCGDQTAFFVYADTDRFGKHEIMYQGASYKDAALWLERQGVSITAADRLEKELSRTGGKIQIGNQMFRSLYRGKDGHIYGRSGSYGVEDITRAFDGAVMIGPDVAKTTTFAFSYQRVKTIKFGAACTW